MWTSDLKFKLKENKEIVLIQKVVEYGGGVECCTTPYVTVYSGDK